MPKVKSHLQQFLIRIGLYQRLRASLLYDCYWMLAGRQVIDQRLIEVEFYRNLLKGMPTGSRIFDIGANHGQKTDVFLRLGARVVAVEPDELNQQVLRQKFLSLRLINKPLIVVGKAVGDKSAVKTMWIDAPGSAKNTLSQKWVETLRVDGSRFGTKLQFSQCREVSTITVEDLIADHGFPFYIKIDVEGYELRVLQGMRHSVPYISFEVNLPEFRSEGLRCVEILERMSAHSKFNYVVDCQQGLALTEWMEPGKFAHVLKICEDKSIEVFCRSCGT